MSTFAQNVPRLCWDSKLKKHVTCPPVVGQSPAGQISSGDPPPRRVCCLEPACCVDCNGLQSMWNCMKSWVENFRADDPTTPDWQTGFFRGPFQGQGQCANWGFGTPGQVVNLPPYEIYDKANGNAVLPCYKVDTPPPPVPATVGVPVAQCIIFRSQVSECQDLGYCFEVTMNEPTPGTYGYTISNVRLCTDPDAVVDEATLDACVSCISSGTTPPVPDTCCIPDTCCLDCDEWWDIFECFKAKVESYSVPGLPGDATTLPVYGGPGDNILLDVNSPACPVYSFHENGEIRKNGSPFSTEAGCGFQYNVSNRLAEPIPLGGSVVQCFLLFSYNATCGTPLTYPVGICFETIAVYENIGGIATWRNQLTNARLCATPTNVTTSEDLNDCIDCETGDVDCPGITVALRFGPTAFVVNTPTSMAVDFPVDLPPACCGDLYALFVSSQPDPGNLGVLNVVGNPFQPLSNMTGLTFEGTNTGDQFTLNFEVISDNCEIVSSSVLVTIS